MLFLQRERLDHDASLGAAVYLHIATCKLPDFLAATAAGCAECVAIAHHHNLGDAFSTRHDEVRNRRWFSTPALRVRGVFNVAATEHAATFIAHCGAYIEF
jgi:hypothetical protein